MDIVLVTGASGPMGSVISRHLSEHNYEVVGLDQVPPRAQDRDVFCDFHIGDLTDVVALENLVDEKLSSMSITHLVNNAAFTPEAAKNQRDYSGPVHEQSSELFLRAFQVNTLAPFILIRDLHRAGTLKSVVNITSTYGKVGPNLSIYTGLPMGNSAAYAASKGGLEQLTRYFSTVLAPGCRVNAVSPGGIERGQPKSFVERYENLTPMKKMNQEINVAEAVLFLLGEGAGYITGTSIDVDGGWRAW